MIRNFRLAAALLGLALVTSGCAPTSLFEWGAYEPALYSYTQNPENRAVYMEALEKAIQRGRARNAVAPGLLAELGYLHMEAGETAEARALFEEERTRFPESAVLMNRVIAGLDGRASASGAH